jgi:hypothetical protein
MTAEVLGRVVEATFGDMVKYVVDVRRGVAAVGGQMHADAQALLLEDGSKHEDLWGANYFPERPSDSCIEFTSLINIRPRQHNPGMEVRDERVRERIREITFALIGTGAPRP